MSIASNYEKLDRTIRNRRTYLSAAEMEQVALQKEIREVLNQAQRMKAWKNSGLTKAEKRSR